MNRVVITQVQEQNIALACDILMESAAWLIQKDMLLWKTGELEPEHMLPYVVRGELFLASIENEPAGTIILQEKDELFWPDIIDNCSLFFHKLAVKRKFAGCGISKALIGYAYQIGKLRGKTYLRMDCSANHAQLRVFYENNGFQFFDQKQVGAWFVNRLFKMIT